jgi:spore germination protein GerM
LIVAAIYFWFASQPKEAGVKAYFFKGEKLMAVERPLKAGEAPLSKAVAELLSGPSETEKAQGISTQIPAGTKALNILIKDEIAIVNFNRKLENYGGGSARLEGMIAQIVYTATEVPGIKKVWIWMEGEKELVLGGEGLVLDKPLSRREIAY